MSTIVFRNVAVFPGHGDSLLPAQDVTIDGPTVAGIAPHDPTSPAGEAATTIQRALHAGVRSIEHGHLVDEETVEMIAEAGAWWCLQPFLDDEDAVPVPPSSRGKYLEMVAGTLTAYELLAEPDRALKVIVKDGAVVKNAL